MINSTEILCQSIVYRMMHKPLNGKGIESILFNCDFTQTFFCWPKSSVYFVTLGVILFKKKKKKKKGWGGGGGGGGEAKKKGWHFFTRPLTRKRHKCWLLWWQLIPFLNYTNSFGKERKLNKWMNIWLSAKRCAWKVDTVGQKKSMK